MKKTGFLIIILAVLVYTAISASAATIWMPDSPDADINYIYVDVEPFITFAIFDDADQDYAKSHLDLNTFDTIFFLKSGNDWDLKRDPAGDTLFTLTGSSRFILGRDLDGGSSWMGDTAKTELSPGMKYR